MLENLLDRFRLRLANTSSQLDYAVLGIFSGLACTLVVLGFRFLLEGFGLWLPEGNEENFEGLPSWLHLCLPIAGALVLGLVMRLMDPQTVRAGTVHVITSLHVKQGQLPIRNTIWQFFAGAFALATGQSGGREGPAIHLGAGTNSYIGQRLQLPNNSLRILVGCGTSAAIAASFNTPIAGVIFAMEVVMMEYTIAGFTPIILSAIIATILTQAFYGSEPILLISAIELNSLWELPFITLMGLVIGACAALFTITLRFTLRHNQRPAIQRMLIAGTLTGCCAFFVPQIMGVGYDTLNASLAGTVPLTLLLLMIAAKILTTAVSTGMGMPIGMIGPNFLIGACIGGAMGVIGSYFSPIPTSHHSLYVLLGMGAMMGAVLNAPLAALLALVELTHTTSIIFPGMLVIAVASLTRSEIFKLPSANNVIIESLQQTLRTDPLSLALQRTSVASVMSYDLTLLAPTINRFDAEALIENPPKWIVVEGDAYQRAVHRGDTFIFQLQRALAETEDSIIDVDQLSLSPIPASSINLQATLKEALDTMDTDGTDLIYIAGRATVGAHQELGMLSRPDIEHYYRSPI